MRLSLFLLAVASCAPSHGDPPADGGAHDVGVDAAPDVAECSAGVLGDTSKPVQIEIRVLSADGKDAPVADGDPVALTFPPQGGRVVFAGVRATNVDGCGLQLSGAVRDEQSRQVRIDSRTINLIPTGDGWGASSLSGGSGASVIASYSNIPLCPNQWSTTDIFGHEYELSITVKDRAGRTATKLVRVTPACAEPARAEECACICKKDYVLGESCAKDAGAD